MFPKNILFNNDFGELKENDDKITLIGEIARNIIIQGNEKLKQIIKYIEFISILNIYKDKIKYSLDSDILSSLYEYCKMSEYTEKIFFLITDGDYFILNKIYNIILPYLIEEKLEKPEDIKKKINEKIKDINGFMDRLENKEIKFIDEKIYDNYLMINNLKKNNIKFFVLYVGDLEQFIYQENLIYKILMNPTLIKENDFNRIKNFLNCNYNLKKVQEATKKLKDIITLFTQNIDEMTEKKLGLLELDSIIKKSKIEFYSPKIRDDTLEDEQIKGLK